MPTNYRTCKQVCNLFAEASVKKSNLSLDQLVLKGVASGIWFGIGVYVSIFASYNAQIQSENWGLGRLIYAVIFPVGHITIILTESEFFTGNTMVMSFGLLHGKIRIHHLLINWIGSYIGNWVGCTLCAWLFFYVPNETPILPQGVIDYSKGLAETKMNRDPFDAFILAIPGNILVTLAVFLQMLCEDMVARIICIWFPIMIFSVCGFEQCIANMFTIPLAMFYDSPITFWKFFYMNQLIITGGNIVGGVLLTFYMWYINIFRENLKEKKYISTSIKKIINTLQGKGAKEDVQDIEMSANPTKTAQTAAAITKE